MEEPYLDCVTLPLLHPGLYTTPQVTTAVKKVIQSVFRGHGTLKNECHPSIKQHGILSDFDPNNNEANNEDYSFIAVIKKVNQKPDGPYIDEEKYWLHNLMRSMYKNNEIVLVRVLLGFLLSPLNPSPPSFVRIVNPWKKMRDGERRCEAAVSVSVRLLCRHHSPPPAICCSESPSLFISLIVETYLMRNRLQELEAEHKQSREENLGIVKRFEVMEEMLESFASNNA
ncbi:unnamed protein product, partial [Thlaspi arvense]